MPWVSPEKSGVGEWASLLWWREVVGQTTTGNGLVFLSLSVRKTKKALTDDSTGLSSAAVDPEEAALGDLGGAFGRCCEEEDSGGFDGLVAALPSSVLDGLCPFWDLLLVSAAVGFCLCEALLPSIAGAAGLLAVSAGRAVRALWSGTVVACCGALL